MVFAKNVVMNIHLYIQNAKKGDCSKKCRSKVSCFTTFFSNRILKLQKSQVINILYRVMNIVKNNTLQTFHSILYLFLYIIRLKAEIYSGFANYLIGNS